MDGWIVARLLIRPVLLLLFILHIVSCPLSLFFFRLPYASSNSLLWLKRFCSEWSDLEISQHSRPPEGNAEVLLMTRSFFSVPRNNFYTFLITPGADLYNSLMCFCSDTTDKYVEWVCYFKKSTISNGDDPIHNNEQALIFKHDGGKQSKEWENQKDFHLLLTSSSICRVNNKLHPFGNIRIQTRLYCLIVPSMLSSSHVLLSLTVLTKKWQHVMFAIIQVQPLFSFLFWRLYFQFGEQIWWKSVTHWKVLNLILRRIFKVTYCILMELFPLQFQLFPILSFGSRSENVCGPSIWGSPGSQGSWHGLHATVGAWGRGQFLRASGEPHQWCVQNFLTSASPRRARPRPQLPGTIE